MRFQTFFWPPYTCSREYSIANLALRRSAWASKLKKRRRIFEISAQNIYLKKHFLLSTSNPWTNIQPLVVLKFHFSTTEQTECQKKCPTISFWWYLLIINFNVSLQDVHCEFQVCNRIGDCIRPICMRTYQTHWDFSCLRFAPWSTVQVNLSFCVSISLVLERILKKNFECFICATNAIRIIDEGF